ncbi:MAG: TorF family putative porin [Gammaproteobacteria bacterium]|nr:TorF family putative porin [Gammaproteobacteria bacterium]
MNKFKSTIFAAGLLAAPLASHAEIAANVALTTDYVWRGVSQTLEDPAIQGGFDYAHESGFAAGVWASNVDFGEGDSADMEFDVYGSFGGEFGDGFSYGVGAIYYAYPGTASGVDYDWLEVSGSLGWGPVSFAVNYSSDVYNSSETGVYYLLSASHEIEGFAFAADVGYYDYDDAVFGAGVPDSNFDYHLGVSTSFVGLDWDLSFYDTDSDGEAIWGDIAEERLVLTVSKSF